MKGSDESFMKKAADGGMAEVQLGQLAEKNGSNDGVKQFGQRMVTDHGKMNDKLKSLAATKNVTLPSSVSGKHKSAYNHLSSKTGAEFDKEYITMMIKDHNEDIAEFRKEADSGTDPDVKALASEALPTLQEHLRMAQDCAKQLGMAPSGGAPGQL
jgi:putative membrane protein